MSHLKTKISVFSIHPMYPSALFACPSSRQNVTETKVKTGIHHFCLKHILFPCLNKAQRTALQSLTPPKPHQLCSCLHTTCPWWQGHREFWLAQFKPSSFFVNLRLAGRVCAGANAQPAQAVGGVLAYPATRVFSPLASGLGVTWLGRGSLWSRMVPSGPETWSGWLE